MLDKKLTFEFTGAPDIGTDFNDHFPTTMELARCAANLMVRAAERDKIAKKQKDIDEVKSFLPQPYQRKYNLI
jgi:hypothetical protein